MRACCQLGDNLYQRNECSSFIINWSSTLQWHWGPVNLCLINITEIDSSLNFISLQIDCVWWNFKHFSNDSDFSFDRVSVIARGCGDHVSCAPDTGLWEWSRDLNAGLWLAPGLGAMCHVWASLAPICYLYHNPDIDTGLPWTNNDLYIGTFVLF